VSFLLPAAQHSLFCAVSIRPALPGWAIVLVTPGQGSQFNKGLLGEELPSLICEDDTLEPFHVSLLTIVQGTQATCSV
jgi:hypothetical protein